MSPCQYVFISVHEIVCIMVKLDYKKIKI